MEREQYVVYALDTVYGPFNSISEATYWADQYFVGQVRFSVWHLEHPDDVWSDIDEVSYE